VYSANFVLLKGVEYKPISSLLQSGYKVILLQELIRSMRWQHFHMAVILVKLHSSERTKDKLL